MIASMAIFQVGVLVGACGVRLSDRFRRREDSRRYLPARFNTFSLLSHSSEAQYNSKSMKDGLFGGVEAGGTKFVCAVGDASGSIVELASFPTTSPEATLQRTLAFFEPHREKLHAVGVGSFGPIDPDPSSATFGYITSTPKPGWQQTDFAGPLREGLSVPIAFDTDTNAAAVGEHRWGAAQGLDTFIYLTVGTGIGGGGLARGRRLRGLVHPEMGHLMLPRADGDEFDGICPFHGDCLEGMICGPALKARTGRPAEELSSDHEIWPIVAHYLSVALVNYICVLSPQRIILGGGVMRQTHLFPAIRDRVQQLLNNYVRTPAILENINDFIVPPALGDRSGVRGAIALAVDAISSGR